MLCLGAASIAAAFPHAHSCAAHLACFQLWLLQQLSLVLLKLLCSQRKWPDVPAMAAARGRYQHGGAACRDMLPSTDSTLRLKGTSLDRVTSCPWSKPVQTAGGCQTSMLAATN